MERQTTSRLASVAIRRDLSEMAQSSLDRYYAVHTTVVPDPERRTKSVRDMGYHLDYLCESLWAGEPELFSNYVSWAAELFASLGFSSQILPDSLDAIWTELNQRLAPDQIETVMHYFVMAHGRLAENSVTPSHLVRSAPHSALAATYLEYLLDGRRQAATQLVLDAVRGGTSVQDIYLHVFQPTQREIGRLWQVNRITVAQEHYVTAATQFIMAQLYPYIFAVKRVGARLVAASVGDELHELGIRMVADFFEMAGWDTYYIGANTPIKDLLATVSDRRADVLAISVTLTTHLTRLAEVVEAARRLPEPPVVLVGGYPFNISPDLWRRLGADGTAADAQSAVRLAESLLA